MLLLFIIVLIILPTIYAIEIKLSKESYYSGETLQAEITGNFIFLKSENILLYRDETPRSLPVISDLSRQGDKYYFYALLPNKKGNYSLKIEDSQYISLGKLITEPIIKDFKIESINQSSDQIILSINPGFLIAKEDFSIKIKSLSKNQEITTIFDQIKNLSLIEGVEKTVYFSLPNEDSNLKIADYNVPIFLIQKSNDSIFPETRKLRFRTLKLISELKAVVTPEQNYFFELFLENTGEENLTNIKLSSDLDAVITPNQIDFLKSKSNIPINITISIPNQNEDLLGEISAEFNDEKISLPVLFEITGNKEEVDLTGTTIKEKLSCSEIGEICSVSEKCDGEETNSLEGTCCKGDCIEIPQSNYRLIIGIIIAILIVILIAYSYWKLKKRQKPKSTKEIFREKSGRYNERVAGKSEEVSKKLEKV